MKIKPKSVPLKLPAILSFFDYHEIRYTEDHFNELTIGRTKIKSEELGFYDGRYQAIFYLKKDKDYKQMVKEVNLSLKEADEEEYYENNEIES